MPQDLFYLTITRVALACTFVTLEMSSSSPGNNSEFASPLAWKKLVAGASERFAFTAVFDPKRASVLVYGGETHVKEQFGFLDDLWEFKVEENSWQQVKVKGGHPSKRAYQMATFDEKTGAMWMFGGMTERFAPLDDLWMLDTATMTWTARTPVGEKPEARFSAGLHFDASRNQLVLYSGCKAFFTADNACPDVWTYDIANNTWAKKKTAAPGRWQAASAIASGMDTLIVQGGFDGNSAGHADTWVYSLADDKWTSAGKGFKSTEAHAAVWDPIAQTMIVFGGTAGAKNGLDQVWSFEPKSKKWSQLATTGENPGGRAYHALAWNSSEKSLWAFGGTLNQFMDEPRKNDAWSLRLHK